MPQFRIRFQREQTVMVDTETVDQAAEIAKSLMASDSSIKILDVVRADLIPPPTPEGGEAA